MSLRSAMGLCTGKLNLTQNVTSSTLTFLPSSSLAPLTSAGFSLPTAILLFNTLMDEAKETRDTRRRSTSPCMTRTFGLY